MHEDAWIHRREGLSTDRHSLRGGGPWLRLPNVPVTTGAGGSDRLQDVGLLDGRQVQGQGALLSRLQGNLHLPDGTVLHVLITQGDCK